MKDFVIMMRVRKAFRPFHAAAAVALALVLLPEAAAAAPASGLEGVGRQVSDADLAHMRGKFISPENVSYFGIQMQTSWQGPDGITTSATLMFSVGFANGAGNANGATPQLLIGYSRSGDPAMDVGTVGSGYIAIAIPAGLNGVQGAVQSQQIAGDDNHVRNGMRVAVVPASLVSNGQPTGLTPVDGGQVVRFADGDTLQFVLANNQLGVGMTSGADSAAQSFNGNLGQLAQHVLLNSDHNSLSNGMSVIVGFDSLEQSSRLNIQNALTSLKGLGF